MLIICLSTVYLDRIYRIFRIFFAFPEERQKPISLFEGVHLAIKTEQRSDMNVQQQYHRPLWLSFPAESGMAISRFRPRPPRKPSRLPRARKADGRERCGQVETEKAIDPINLVNPVQYKNYN